VGRILSTLHFKAAGLSHLISSQPIPIPLPSPHLPPPKAPIPSGHITNTPSSQIGTTQACAFRDSYTPLTTAGLSVYGLSTDSPKSNTTFVTKQKLPYTLLCDPKATLIRAIGMYKGGAGSGTSRGVVVLDKKGVCRVWFMGGVSGIFFFGLVGFGLILGRGCLGLGILSIGLVCRVVLLLWTILLFCLPSYAIPFSCLVDMDGAH
jgi:hypothetical protein